MNEKDIIEFDVLGQKVRFRAKDEQGFHPALVVEYVQKIANELQTNHSISDKTQLAVLTALKIAQDKLHLEGDYKQSIHDLQIVAKDALDMIDEAVPLQ